MPGRYWLETLGCPKNQVDSDKLAGVLTDDGLLPAARPEDADVVVVNTCAFIEAARQESVDTILALADVRRSGARLVVTGCLAERSGAELAAALPEVDLVAGFGEPLVPGPGSVPVELGRRAPAGGGHGTGDHGAGDHGTGDHGTGDHGTGGVARDVARMDLLNLRRPPARAPWAYVKVAEGCDRACGFCAIPSFRGRQRSRTVASIVAEVDQLGVAEVVLVAQDLASYGRDATAPGGRAGDGPGIHDLVAAVADRVARTRLLYLYPSELTDRLVDTICATGVPYFDLSLQHVSRPLLRRMRRWGDGRRFLERIAAIRRREPAAAFRSSFIVGYPGETEEDHDRLLAFLEEARLDWVGFFPYSAEDGTHAARLDGAVEPSLVEERLRELGELQDRITAERRLALVGEETGVLVDAPGVARSHREAPEIDGVIAVPADLPPGTMTTVRITGAIGPDLEAEPLAPALCAPWG